MSVKDMVVIRELEKIMRSERSEIDRLAAGFDLITSWYINNSQNEIELRRAMADTESLVKEQIKLSTMKHSRSIFADCFFRVSGRNAWDE